MSVSVVMEEAGCIFYPDTLIFRPMNRDGSPDMHEGVAISALEIDIADMGEFSNDNWQIIFKAIRENRPEDERKEIDSIREKWKQLKSKTA